MNNTHDRDTRAGAMAAVATKPPSPPRKSAPLPPSPQEFYATVTKRPDIREILKRLARA